MNLRWYGYRIRTSDRAPGNQLRALGSTFLRCLPLVILFASGLSTGFAADVPGNESVIVRRERFSSQRAADLVKQARACDPVLIAGDEADRDKAVELYSQAIALHPHADINPHLYERIAQLYSFISRPAAGVSPDHAKAVVYWQGCIRSAPEKQYLWARAHMGLASTSFVQKDIPTAISSYRRILEVDPDQLELPPSRVLRGAGTERGQVIKRRELERLRGKVDGIQARAVDKLFHATCRFSRDAAILAVQQVASEHRGKPVGRHAEQLLARVGGTMLPGTDSFAELATDSPASKVPEKATSNSETASDHTGVSTDSAPPLPAATQAEPTMAVSPLPWITALAVLALAFSLFRYYRRPASSQQEEYEK